MLNVSLKMRTELGVARCWEQRLCVEEEAAPACFVEFAAVGLSPLAWHGAFVSFCR